MKTLKEYYRAQIDAEKLNVPYPKRTASQLRKEIADLENRMATLSPDELFDELLDLGKGHSIKEVNGPFGKYFMTSDGRMSIGDDKAKLIRDSYNDQIRILHKMSDELILPSLPARDAIKDSYTVDELSELSKARYDLARKAGMSEDGATDYALIDTEMEHQQFEVSGSHIRFVDMHGKILFFDIHDVETAFEIRLNTEAEKKEVAGILAANLELRADVEEEDFVNICRENFNDSWGDMSEDLQERFGDPEVNDEDADEDEDE
jgi:hypothetical protein